MQMWRFVVALLGSACCSAAQAPPSDWAPLVAAGRMLFASSIPQPGFFPSIGNGNIAGTVGCYARSESSVVSTRADFPRRAGVGGAQDEWAGVLYMAGVFNGRSYETPSQRAQLPGLHSATLAASTGESLQTVGAALDLQTGVFYNRTKLRSSACPAADDSTDGGWVEVEQSWLAHRSERQLLLHSITVRGARDNASCTLHMALCNADPTPRTDFNISREPWARPAQGGVSGSSAPWSLRARTLQAEESDLPLSSVGGAYDVLPSTVIIAPVYAVDGDHGSSTQGIDRRITFIAALRSSAEMGSGASAEQLAEQAQADYKAATARGWDELMASNARAWAEEWRGGVEVEGNLTLASTLNSSLYYILNALRADVPMGISPGGLASNAYDGHSFWDCETWMFPNLLAFNPALAASLLRYRTERLPAALANARAHNESGAMWPWESAVSGVGVSPWREADQFEQHITGDIALAFRSYYYATRNISWLRTEAWPVLSASCDFFAGRASPVAATNGTNLTLTRVIGPDEQAGVVDSNAYTNGLARATLRFCDDAAAVLGVTPAASWATTAERMWLPLSNSLYDAGPVHPEFAGYKKGQAINQADVALLQYPLDMTAEMGATVARNDLLYYAPLSSGPTTSGFYTGDSAYSIAWLALGNRSAADAQLRLAFDHMDTAHFNVWSEVSHNGVLSGHSNFLTGAGGYVQNLVNGYAGLRYDAQGLRLLPVLPPYGARRVVLRAVAFAGARITFDYDAEELRATLVGKGDVALQIMCVGASAPAQHLGLDRVVALQRSNGLEFRVVVMHKM